MTNMRVLRPGQNGTKRLVEQYGDQLLCVRYRYDYQKQKAYKTIELIISEQDWHPASPHPDEEIATPLIERISTRQVAVRIEWHEQNLQQVMRKIGGKWNRQQKLWYAPEYAVQKVGLAERIVKK